MFETDDRQTYDQFKDSNLEVLQQKFDQIMDVHNHFNETLDDGGVTLRVGRGCSKAEGIVVCPHMTLMQADKGKRKNYHVLYFELGGGESQA